MTLTSDPAIWFLFATHHLVMMIIRAKLFSNPIMYGLLWPRHDSETQTSAISRRGHNFFFFFFFFFFWGGGGRGAGGRGDATSDLAIYFLFVIHHLVMMIICAKFFVNSSCTAKLWPTHNSGTQTHTHTHIG